MRGPIATILAILTIFSMVSTGLGTPMNFSGLNCLRQPQRTVPEPLAQTTVRGALPTVITHNHETIAGFHIDMDSATFHMSRWGSPDIDELCLYNKTLQQSHTISMNSKSIAVELSPLGWEITHAYEVRYFGTTETPNPET